MLQTLLKSSFLCALMTAPALAQTIRMEDPHEHGHGSVSIAIDGAQLTLLVETPAHDVLGFEHTATTAEDKRLVAAVRGLLERPETLFDLPSGGGCSLVESTVAIGPEGHGHHDHSHERAGEAHSDIEAEYRFSCRSTAALTRIGFPWFEAFPLSQELDVVVLDGRGSHVGSVSPNAPEFSFP